MAEQLLRVIANSGAFRVLGVVTTEAVSTAVRSQGLNGPVSEAFGRLMTGVALIRSTIHPDERMQVTMRHNGPAGDLMIDVWPGGMIRGRARVADAMPSEACNGGVVGDLGVVEVARSRKQDGGKIHQSVTLMITGTIQDELQLYLLESEQIASNLHLEVKLDAKGNVMWAGGVLLQLLPEAKTADLASVVEHIDNLGALSELNSLNEPESLIRSVLPDDMEFTVVGEESLFFGCNCDTKRVLSSLSTLPQEEIQEMLQGSEIIELNCGFCNKVYQLEPEQLRSLLV